MKSQMGRPRQPRAMSAAKLKSARLRAGWTQAELASLIPISEFSYIMWETGRFVISAKRAEQILLAFTKAGKVPPKGLGA